MLVLDASAALAWIFKRRDENEAERARGILIGLRGRGATVPDLWHIEIVNALATAHRRKLLRVSEASAFLAKLEALPIETDRAPARQRRNEILALAREYRLSAYDATYLDLALRTEAALVTFDRRLAEAQRQAGIPCS
jgi:predicted nucleic acid-binding protein